MVNGPMKLMRLLDPLLVVQLMELFQKLPRRGVISPTWVAFINSLAPLVRSMFQPGESERDGVDHCESSIV
jgi:hypothetical protein